MFFSINIAHTRGVDELYCINSMRLANVYLASPGRWRLGECVCAFADSERRLGHIFKLESLWVAFDGTRLGQNGIGFRMIGSFPDLDTAKVAVEFASLTMNTMARAS
jgi:hypothetical protein